MLTLFQGDFGIRDTIRYIEDTLGAGLWSWDLKTNAMEWSRGLFSLFDLQPDAVSPHFDVFASMIHPDDRLPPSDVKRTIAAMPLHREFRIISRNRRVRWVYNQGEALIEPDGSATRAIGVMRDVTAYREMIGKIQINEGRLQAITDAVGTPFWITDIDGVTTALGNWRELRDDRVDAAPGAPRIDLVHPDDRAATLEAWAGARSRCEVYQVEHRVLQPDGSYRWQLSRAIPLKSSDGKIEEYVGTTLDIHTAKVLPSMKDAERRLTGAQIRAARGILRWSVRDLADRANVSAAAIRRLEEIDGATEEDLVAPISRALKAAGVDFFAALVGKPGASPS